MALLPGVFWPPSGREYHRDRERGPEPERGTEGGSQTESETDENQNLESVACGRERPE